MVSGIILANDTEINYAKQNGLNDSLNLSLAPFVKRITIRNRERLDANGYSFSRVRALIKAQELAPNLRLLQVSQTKV